MSGSGTKVSGAMTTERTRTRYYLMLYRLLTCSVESAGLRYVNCPPGPALEGPCAPSSWYNCYHTCKMPRGYNLCNTGVFSTAQGEVGWLVAAESTDEAVTLRCPYFVRGFADELHTFSVEMSNAPLASPPASQKSPSTSSLVALCFRFCCAKGIFFWT